MNFGATVDGVQGYVSAFRIANDTRPSWVDVERWIETYDGIVSLILGPLDAFARTAATADELADIRAAGRRCVELAAGADTLDVAYPERAARTTSDLGNVLRQRYDASIKDLERRVETRRAAILAGDSAGEGTTGAPAWDFPSPSFQRDRAW